MLSNAYFLAKFRFDTAENEPAKNLQNFRKMHFEVAHGLQPRDPGGGAGPGQRQGGRGREPLRRARRRARGQAVHRPDPGVRLGLVPRNAALRGIGQT